VIRPDVFLGMSGKMNLFFRSKKSPDFQIGSRGLALLGLKPKLRGLGDFAFQTEEA